MERAYDAITFIENITLITKKHQDEERELKAHFEEAFIGILRKLVEMIDTFEEVIMLLHSLVRNLKKKKQWFRS